MRKYLSEKCENMLNEILGALFQMNSITDNMSYALDCELNCPITAKIFHLKYAHAFPSDQFADKLSDTMIKNNLRPVRKGLVEDIKLYNNINELFHENMTEIDKLKNLIANSIYELDCDIENKAIVILLEEILSDLMTYYKQADIWVTKAEEYFANNNTRQFDIHFEHFTFL